MSTETERAPVVYTYASQGMMREKTCASREEAISEAVAAFKVGREWPTEIREGKVVVWQTRRSTTGIRDSLRAIALAYSVDWGY
ncbi:MAG TPA: hypothetical protein VL069_07925 [Opitutus sp.]|nr:hypothetical protein [Opitutus sp.]